MIRARPVGTGHFVPERRVTNDELPRELDTSDEWIRSRTGIRERRLLSDGEVTSDMAAEAGRRACEMAGIAPSQLDVIVVATVSADMPMPSCAVVTQQKLGARCPAFDISAACAGFSYGLTVVDSLLRSGKFRNALLIGAEGLSRFLDWTDRGTCVLFGDGAGAILLVAEKGERGVLGTHIEADGAFVPALYTPWGGTLTMDGRTVFGQAVRAMSDACLKVLGALDLTADDLDWVLPHQANLRIIDAIIKRLSLDARKVMINLERFGNTSSASIPIALDEAVRDGRIRDGSMILSCGMGSGLVWGAAVMRW